MDDGDRAKDIVDRLVDDALERRRRRAAEAKDVAQIACTVCSEEIPERRRQAVPGCTRCVNCQELLENWR
jgi:phage/conjugal plasmid C-4 type zinc finger TraR family protein